VSRPLDCLFTPRRVAVVGASERAGSAGQILWRNLASFDGEVIPVTPSTVTVGGVTTYRTLRDVPGTVDLAVVAVPADAAVDVVADAAAADVGCCIVLAAGFAESGPEGVRRQRALVAAARAGNVLLVGPNCLGVQNLDLGLNASLASGTGTGGGGISVVTHSGSYAMALNALSQDEGIGFSCAYSAGNAADLADHEVITHLANNPGTRVVAVFVESLTHGRAFLDAARRVTSHTPVVVAAVGSSEAGGRSAASHTAALATNRRVWQDVLTGAGVTVVRTGLEMLDAARVLAAGPPPAGPRVAVVTNSGGTGTELADLLTAEGLDLPVLSPHVQRTLAALLPQYAATGNPVDLTPVWARYAELYPQIVDILARSGEIDVVVPVLLHRAAENAEVAAGLVRVRRSLEAEQVNVPLVVCWVAPDRARPQMLALHDGEVPCLPWAERTARAVGHAVRTGDWQRSEPDPPLARPSPRSLPEHATNGLAASGEFLRAQGLPLAPTIGCTSVQQAVDAALHLGMPVVLKVDHPELRHKTDVGGVRTGLSNPDEVAAAASTLLGLAPGARVVVQPQLRGTELVVGALRDATFGPVVAVGVGGVHVELIDEIAFAAAPLQPRDARRLFDRPRLARVLDGWRGAPAVDRAALTELICQVGDVIATYPRIDALDLNPVIATPDGLVAVDWRLVDSSA
jgi:acetyltransferase